MILTKFFILPSLSLWAAYSIFYFSYQNGFIRQMQEVIGSRILQPGNVPLQMDFTGVAAIDEVLSCFIPFFWSVVDGSSPSLSLHAFNFVGALVAIFALVTIESLRKCGNDNGKITLVGFFLLPPVFGVLCQVLTFGVLMPIYVILHLSTYGPRGRVSWKNAGPLIAQLKAVPLSIVVGHLLPCLLVALPDEMSGLRLSKQTIIAFWQLFPVWISLVRLFVCKVKSGFTTTSGDGMPNGQLELGTSLRYIYSFAFCCACIPHLISWSISIGTLIFPTAYNSNLVDSLAPGLVFFNTLPWSSDIPKSIGEGALWFLQWDQLIGTAALLIWATTLYVSALLAHGLSVDTFGLTVRVIILCFVAGPAGAAVDLMWEREELGLQVEERTGSAKKTL